MLNQKKLIGIWNGGEAFDAIYQEKYFLIEFTKSSFHIQYGPNHYAQYTGYVLEKDTLIITCFDNREKQYRPRFKIMKLDSSELVLEVANWAAAFISSVLSSPYLEGYDEEEIFKNTAKDLTGEGVIRTRLTFKRG